jgi:hypothetical protein
MTRRYTLMTGDARMEVLVVLNDDDAPPHVALRPGPASDENLRVWGPPLTVVREDHDQ